MYKQIKKQLADKRIIQDTKEGLAKRIKYKIDNQLGYPGMSYQEVKIQCGTSTDRFVRAFAQLEDLDNQRRQLQDEENIIDDMLEKINKHILELDETEHKVFRYLYLWGLTQQETADKLGYSIQRVKQISSDIREKIKV